MHLLLSLSCFACFILSAYAFAGGSAAHGAALAVLSAIVAFALRSYGSVSKIDVHHQTRVNHHHHDPVHIHHDHRGHREH